MLIKYFMEQTKYFMTFLCWETSTNNLTVISFGSGELEPINFCGNWKELINCASITFLAAVAENVIILVCHSG